MLNARAPSATFRAESTALDPATDVLGLIPQDVTDVFYAEHPERGIAVAGAGIAAEVRTAGRDRFTRASADGRALLESVAIDEGPSPLLVGGFAFGAADPRDWRWIGFPALRLVLPARLWIRRDGRVWELRTTGPASTSHPVPHAPNVPTMRDAGDVDDDRSAWQAAVERALAAIASGRLEKVVLARTRIVDAAIGDPVSLVARLRDTRPGCVTFWVGHGARSFVGSSPETLARVEDGCVDVVALAGSARRGADVASDRAAALCLARCAKNGREHALVAVEIEATLRALDVRLEPRCAPVVRAFPEALHLATRFRGTVARGSDALRIAGALHPTPAVCGVPRAAAAALIEDVEGERGWYAGGIGWLDAEGNGTFAAALRCGLLGAGAPRVFAGAGIVAGSQPAAEYDETEAKMEAMRRALAEAGRV